MFKDNTLYFDADLRIFDNTQTTLLNAPGNDLSPAMKIFYSDHLIDNAEPELVYDQFGTSYPIPKGKGKSIEFRKYDPLPKATTPLVEGVTPKGNKLNMGTVTAEVNQFGSYVEISDVLELTAIDPQLEEAGVLLGGQAGRTMDTITRDIVTAGTNVMYAPLEMEVDGQKTTQEVLSRAMVAPGFCRLTPALIRKAVTKLKRMNAKPMGDSFVGIIHPDVAADLMASDEWIEAHKYAQPENIYNGELGKIAGVRFVESTEAKIFGPPKFADAFDTEKVIAWGNPENDSKRIIIPIEDESADVNGIANKINHTIASRGLNIYIHVPEEGEEPGFGSVVIPANATGQDDVSFPVVSAAVQDGVAIVLTLGRDLTGDVFQNAYACEVGGNIFGNGVYGTMIIGANAYGTTSVDGGGLRHIVKQLGSAGSGDPLDQRATVGWKALKTAVRLTEAYMVRIEHSSDSFGAEAVAN